LSQEENHVMELVQTHLSGSEEWHCRICGRRFLMQWTPEYRRILLNPGDETARHSGSKGGLQLSSFQVEQDSEQDIPNEPGLQPWLEWLSEINLDTRLDNET
jgi:hypothetical protein